jgi:hypothetical protein
MDNGWYNESKWIPYGWYKSRGYGDQLIIQGKGD